MPVRYSSNDIGRIFDSRLLMRGRSLGLIGAVKLVLAGDTIDAEVEDKGTTYTASVTPAALGGRVVFDCTCSCGVTNCAHLAATVLGALDRYPELRVIDQPSSLLDRITAAPAGETQHLIIELAPAPPDGCTLGFVLIGQTSRQRTATTPRAVLADPNRSPQMRAIASLMGGSSLLVAPIPPEAISQVLTQSAHTKRVLWKPSGKPLTLGRDRSYPAGQPPALPPNSAQLTTGSGAWYVDGSTGTAGPMRLYEPPPEAANARAAKKTERRPAKRSAISTQTIIERPHTPVIRLGRLECPDEYGRPRPTDTLALLFDYGGVVVAVDDERQFLRVNGPGGPEFVRRNAEAETATIESLRTDGFVQMRVADRIAVRGRMVFTYRGREASENWQRFMSERLPVLRGAGWRDTIEPGFGPREVEQVGAWDMRVLDGAAGGVPGTFTLEPGIEIEGIRVPLLPILNRLLEQGGMDAARVIDDALITSLEDGRVVRLPAARIRRLLAVMGDLLGAAKRVSADALVLPPTEITAVLDLEDILAARFDDGQAIRGQIDRFRAEAELPHSPIPALFTASLRPYQQRGVDWLQDLLRHGLSGLLADDMGLGKTAQTIAHIAVEHASGRMLSPALIVVPTSLVPNWTNELAKFAPHLRVLVLHGLERHEKRSQLAEMHVVITTYTVLARDIEEMKTAPFHLVVLDEAQAIKSPYAKATLAVCQLEARQRICLSGTPIENNLGELWSQFAFLMPGLLGGRRDFARRFRLPIERRGDDVRRLQLVRRIRPFMLRRTKAEVVPELPPKHTILRRVTLAPDQRELYETIRAAQHESVRDHIAASGLAQSRIAVLDALLKLRQACCDPRLVKIESARSVTSSSKLEDLIEMVSEMVSEGRRILIFSQFTSMLDLIAPRLDAAKISYVSLRGDTRDRAAPVDRFEAGDVPVFLISLKAGGRGLNLVSADTVIHYDPWWNPAVEDQASDRAHRIGQTKSVFVFKLIAADTVEERILDLQQRKSALADLAFSDEQDVAALGFEDIDYLFSAEPAQQAA